MDPEIQVTRTNSIPNQYLPFHLQFQKALKIVPKRAKRATFVNRKNNRQSQQDESGIVIFRHYLGLRPVGNLRACCLPQKWQPFLRLPLRNRTLIPRYPSKPLWASMPQSTVDRAHLGRIRRRCMTVRSAQSYSESTNRTFGFDLIQLVKQSGRPKAGPNGPAGAGAEHWPMLAPKVKVKPSLKEFA